MADFCLGEEFACFSPDLLDKEQFSEGFFRRICLPQLDFSKWAQFSDVITWTEDATGMLLLERILVI